MCGKGRSPGEKKEYLRGKGLMEDGKEVRDVWIATLLDDVVAGRVEKWLSGETAEDFDLIVRSGKVGGVDNVKEKK